MESEPFSFGRPLNQRASIDLGTKRFETIAYDHETYSFLNSATDPTSCFAKLLNLTAQDLIARTIFFLDFDRYFPGPRQLSATDIAGKATDSWMAMYTTESPPGYSISIPLYGETIDAGTIDETAELYLKKAEEQLKSHLEFVRMVFEMLQGAFDQYSRFLIIEAAQNLLDRKFILKAGTLGKNEVRDLIRKVLNDRVMPKLKEDIETNAKRKLTSVPSVTSFSGLQTYKLLRLWEEYKSSFTPLFENLTLLQSEYVTIDMPTISAFLQKLEKLQVVKEIHVKGGCVNFSNCSYYIDTYSMSHVVSSCPECSRQSLFWMAFGLLDERILHAWRMHLLPEMIVGAIMSREDWVDGVWVHEKVRQTAPISTKTCEVDCLVKTRDGKLLLVETSATRDMEHVHNNFRDKIDALKQLQYDGMFYVAPVNMSDYISEIGSRAFLLGLRNFHDIPGTIKGAMKEKLHNEILLPQSSHDSAEVSS